MTNYDLLDAVPLGVFVLDADYTVLFWNMTLEDWTKIPRDTIVGNSIESHFPNILRPGYDRRLEGIFQGGPPSIFSPQLHQYMIPIPIGHDTFQVQQTTVTAVPRPDTGYHAMFSIQDMTDVYHRIQAYRNMRDEALHEVAERRRVEDALKGSEARYRDLSELISDFAFSLTRQPDGSYQRDWVTDAFQYITGYQLDEFNTIRDWQRIIHPEDISDARRVFQTLQAAWTDERLEHRILTKTGEIRYIQTYYRPVIDTDQKVVTKIFGAAQDITRRKLAEEELRLSEERFRQIAESLDVVIYITDQPSGRVIYTNPAYETVIGQSRRQLYQNSTAYYPFIHSEDYDQVIETMIAAQKEQHGLDIVYRIWKGGDRTKLRWIRERRLPIENLDSPSKRYISLLEDVTDQRITTEKNFNFALEREQIKMLSTFINDATHEFRTPLSIISSSLYLLNKIQDPAKQERYTTLIQEQVTAISELVDVLVLMVDLDKSVEPNPERIDVNNLLKMILDQFAVRIRDSRHIVKTQFFGAPLPVHGQPMQIWQALVAVLENAIRYTPMGGSIMLRSAKQDQLAILEIEDTGVGIAPEEQERIFDRFYRGDQAHSTRGFGLGLPIARKIIDQHGGTITLTSNIGEGSLFRITLPLEQPASEG